MTGPDCDLDESRNLVFFDSLTDRQFGLPCAEAEVVTIPPGVTTKRFGGGRGLGLETATRIDDGHPGNVWAESKPGDTCFTLLLPLTVAPDSPLPDFSPRAFPNPTAPDIETNPTSGS
jgi:light-regulated signal transduction histidine kinase (bacteriophytochrome)